MKKENFYEWMLADGLSEDTARSRLSNCQTIEDLQHVDLDVEYESDRCEKLIELFTYTTADERAKRLPLHKVPIDGNIRNGSATYKSSIKKYAAFRDSEKGMHLFANVTCLKKGANHKSHSKKKHANDLNRESYQEFLDAFGIDSHAICDYGIDASVFADPKIAFEQWQKVKTALQNNAELPIRAKNGGAGDREFQFYKRLNQYVFGNEKLKSDSTGNYYPRRNLEQAVGWDVTIHPDSDTGTLVNYQTSHVLSGRTHNPLLYSAVWNIVFTPKIIDPFTGEEAHGKTAELFRSTFLSHVRAIFSECIMDYNEFVQEQCIDSKITSFQDAYFEQEELMRFKEAARRQWAMV